MGLTLQEAIKSGRRFRRPCWVAWAFSYGDEPCGNYMIKDLFATDYELEPLPKKKKTVWIAVSPKEDGVKHNCTYPFDLEEDAKRHACTGWPVYPLEIECEE